jgi:hypothetical protein
MCSVPNIAIVCSSFMLRFPGMLLSYFLNDSEMVSVVPIITGFALVFTFHIRCMSVVRSLHLTRKIFAALLLLLLLLMHFIYVKSFFI